MSLPLLPIRAAGLKPGAGFAPLMLDPKKLQTPKPVATGAPVVSLESTQSFGVQLVQADPRADIALRTMLTSFDMDGRQRVGVPPDWYKRATIRITVHDIRDVSERQRVMQKVYEVLTTTVGSIEADYVLVLGTSYASSGGKYLQPLGHTVIFSKPLREGHSPAPPLVGLDANLFPQGEEIFDGWKHTAKTFSSRHVFFTFAKQRLAGAGLGKRKSGHESRRRAPDVGK